jgi:CHAD domain-containing protein
MSVSITFENRRAGTREARRILRLQVRKALKKLRHGHPSATDIHAARKEIKKARATLKLLRNAVSKADYSDENDTLREAAHPLSAARDSTILVDTLDRLLVDHASARRIAGTRRLRHRLVHDRNEAHRHAATSAAGVRQSRRLLHRAQTHAARLSVGHHGWSRLGRALLRLYRQGHQSLQEVCAEPTVARLHTWRKRTKYLSHQLQLLEPLSPQRLGRFARELHRLSDYLGDDHDLAVLREHVASDSEVFPDEASQIALMALIDHSRTALQRKSLLLGVRLYRENPGHFESRVHHYWLRWRHAGNHSS